MTVLVLVLLQAAPIAARTGVFASPRMQESSGVAVSRTHAGVLWTHNDSGDGPYLYATNLSGADRGLLRVPGADAVDWEDIALGPCPTRAGTCVYVADTGDNDEKRASVTLYAVPEPALPRSPRDTTATPAVLRLQYPDGPHDVEATFVSFRDGAVYLVTKGRSGTIALYRVARDLWRSRSVVTAVKLQVLPIRPNQPVGRWVTGATMRADGRLVAIRTYTEIYLFTPRASGRLTEVEWSPCEIAGLEPQGEGIDFLNDSTLVLTSEATARTPGTIHTVRCR